MLFLLVIIRGSLYPFVICRHHLGTNFICLFLRICFFVTPLQILSLMYFCGIVKWHTKNLWSHAFSGYCIADERMEVQSPVLHVLMSVLSYLFVVVDVAHAARSDRRY